MALGFSNIGNFNNNSGGQETSGAIASAQGGMPAVFGGIFSGDSSSSGIETSGALASLFSGAIISDNDGSESSGGEITFGSGLSSGGGGGSSGGGGCGTIG